MKNHISIKLRIFSLVLVLIVSFTQLTSFALEGWHAIGDHMVYLNKNDQMVSNAWMESDGMKFYLDNEGHVLYNKVFEYNEDIYYVNAQGAKVTNYFLEVTDDLIVGNDIKPGLFYFSDNGRAFRKTDTNFIKVIDGKKYAFDEDGHVLKDCWISKTGDVVEDASEIINDGCFRSNHYGVLYQNQWYDFGSDVGADEDFPDASWFNIDQYGDMNGLWMYFGNNCRKYAASDNNAKKLTVQGKEYVFDQYGIMVQGFTKNQNAADTNQKSNPIIAEKIKYYDKITGQLVQNRWIRDLTPISFSESEYNNGSDYWFYVGSDGSIVKNKVMNIDNKKYIFDGFGRLRQGFILVDRKAFFVAEYKGEDLSKNDFVYSVAEGGRLYGSDLSDVYYFDEDEESDGNMRSGKVRVELSDGTFEFDFRKNGKAVGNRNELKLYKNCYYRNGIKLVPWEDTKYGIVKVAADEYKVINSTGRILNSKRQVIIDDYDNFIVILNGRLAGYVKQTNRKVQLKWRTINGITGYYYYDMDLEKKKITNLCIEAGTTEPTNAMLKDIPDDLKVNFK